MQWESYEPREYEGVRYGVKADSFAPYFDLPRRVGPVLEVAVGGSAAPRAILRDHRWNVRDAREVAPDPWLYRRYIQRSRGEFAVAKHAYVATRSGWFSERSASYLASGRPVVTQETGFSGWLPTGEGVLPFSTPDDVVAAIDDVRSRYQLHCDAAAEIGRAWFDSRLVLESLLSRVLAPAPAPVGAAR